MSSIGVGPWIGVHAADAPQAANSSADAKAEHFDINEIRVLGNSVLPVRAIEQAVYPFTGPGKSIDDVQAARAALEKAFHDAGYGTVFVDIPEQDVGEGIVRLRATEGRLDRVRVSGARYFSKRQILAAMPTATAGEVPRLPALQSEVAGVNAASADRAVTPILKAGRTPGTVDLELRVNDTLPLHGGVTLNNRNTPETTALRSTVDLSYGNLFQDFQSVAFEYQTAPERLADERVMSLTYISPLWFGKNLLALYAIDNSSDVAAVGSLELLGIGQIYGAHFIHPFDAAGAFSQNLNVGGDLKVFSQTVNVIGQPPDKTPIRYLNWSAVYTLSKSSPRHDTNFSLGVDFGIPSVVNRPSQFDYKRFNAPADYMYLRGSFEQRQSLLFGTAVDVHLTGQYTDVPLVSNEQFGVGGADTVRGYLESVALGDRGGTASLELRGPIWGFGPHPGDNHLGLFAFYDTGTVWTVDPLPDQQAHFSLSSYGAGLRFIALHGFEGVVDWADPLRTVSTVRAGHSRIEFQAHFGF
ncbi:MAG TPA: ShlB/FhaC/HecB family hemolysin secretion/activation protein [Steroidobacteraceae bacterium]|jgi:hemolysin activation/secretion protein